MSFEWQWMIIVINIALVNKDSLLLLYPTCSSPSLCLIQSLLCNQTTYQLCVYNMCISWLDYFKSALSGDNNGHLMIQLFSKKQHGEIDKKRNRCVRENDSHINCQLPHIQYNCKFLKQIEKNKIAIILKRWYFCNKYVKSWYIFQIPNYILFNLY